ncbi:hypothetical protein WL29_21445 [Burkholderia ubonensis]|uniref:Uncharacterized protein n=1 Tax=Burkholderia ubonensis TaxID=101571 RepID=A0A106QD72_9BURK|nr:hypothetical protein WL29_21445 [Burkholderia ubonensis]
MGLIAAAIVLVGWLHLSFSFIAPALWGPYAFAFADAGPLVLSRGGFLLAFSVFPAWAVFFPLWHAKNILQWLAFQLAAAWIAVMVVVCYGFYIHNIVNLQGVDASLEFFASEVGFENAAAVPANVKAAFVLSDKLARNGESPWLPGVWKSVDWPAIPAKQAR